MAKNDKYTPDYKKLYPGIEISPEILAVLKQSDRKMKYLEVDLKAERFIHDQNTDTVFFLPSREDSYERMIADEHRQFVSDITRPEDETLRNEQISKLRAALLRLEPNETALIHALFYKGMSERQLSKSTGIPYMTIHNRKRRILVKLRKLLEK